MAAVYLREHWSCDSGLLPLPDTCAKFSGRCSQRASPGCPTHIAGRFRLPHALQGVGPAASRHKISGQLCLTGGPQLRAWCRAVHSCACPPLLFQQPVPELFQNMAVLRDVDVLHVGLLTCAGVLQECETTKSGASCVHNAVPRCSRCVLHKLGLDIILSNLVLLQGLLSMPNRPGKPCKSWAKQRLVIHYLSQKYVGCPSWWP